MLDREGLRGARGQADSVGDVVRCLSVEVVVGEVGGVHAGVGDEDSFEAVEDEEEGLAVEGGEELCLAVGRGDLLDFGERASGDVGEGAGDEVLEGGVGLVEAPPQATSERGHLLRGDVVEPLPSERALAHAADGDDVEDARAVDSCVGPGDPVGEEVEFGLAADEAVCLQQRVGVGDEGLGRLGDVANVVELGEVGLTKFGEALDNECKKLVGGLEEPNYPLGLKPFLESFEFFRARARLDIIRRERMVVMH